jgi:hypothetical protein
MLRKLFIPVFLLTILVPCILFAQSCSNASGQTMAFTLSPGAKAAWNAATNGVRQSTTQSKTGFSFSAFQASAGRIVMRTSALKIERPLMISIYSVSGSKRGALGITGTTAEFNLHLVPGVYFARLEADGVCLGSTRFLVGR